MKRNKATIVVKINKPAERSGHYNYQGGKTVFDNRPKRMRTRASQRNFAIRDKSY